MFDPNINNINHYNAEMNKSIIDKAFFIDKVDAEIFVDFGCGDGSLIAFIEKIMPSAICIGYDISKDELAIAATNTNSKLFSNFKNLITHLDTIRGDKRVAVICNSLIHEVYAYGDDLSVAKFWNQIYTNQFDYVVIRDMCVSENVNRQSDPVSVAKVRQRFDRARLREFEAEWGVIDGNWSLVHFLLKYRYKINWQREVKENYLPLVYEELLRLVPLQYDPMYVDHYILPFVRRQANIDLGIDIVDNTHIKLILELGK
jgi:SAM-dependent methyltransferase